MKTIILITTVLLSQLCLAGTGGGGVMAVAALTKNVNLMNSGDLLAKRPTEIVYNIGKKDGIVKFAYGQLVGQDWQVQNIEVSEAELMTDASVVKALQNSSMSKSWAEIK